jgi:flavorubredoxin
MRVVVLYESLTGNTRKAAEMIAAELERRGHEVVVNPVTAIDHQALARCDLVVVGAWTDGIFFFGQRPGRSWRIRGLPPMDGKRCVVFCTFALDPGKVLEKLQALMAERGAEVLGGMTIRRDRLEEGAVDFADRVAALIAA